MDFPLGAKVKDIVTGFTGIAMSETKYLTGCNRIMVTPPVDKEGKIIDNQWVDVEQLKILKLDAVKVKIRLTSGGPNPPAR